MQSTTVRSVNIMHACTTKITLQSAMPPIPLAIDILAWVLLTMIMVYVCVHVLVCSDPVRDNGSVMQGLSSLGSMLVRKTYSTAKLYM